MRNVIRSPRADDGRRKFEMRYPECMDELLEFIPSSLTRYVHYTLLSIEGMLMVGLLLRRYCPNLRSSYRLSSMKTPSRTGDPSCHPSAHNSYPPTTHLHLHHHHIHTLLYITMDHPPPLNYSCRTTQTPYILRTLKQYSIINIIYHNIINAFRQNKCTIKLNASNKNKTM